MSGTVTPGGPVTDLNFGFVSGTLEYEISLLTTGFLDLPATIPPGPNRSGNVISGSVDGTITIPFLVDESYELFQLGDSHLVMEGQIVATRVPVLQAGDANQDVRFDQLDIVAVLSAGKYRTAAPATWGEGDWNGAPGGCVDFPPTGDGVFDQFDIIAAQQTGNYLMGAYAGRHADNPIDTDVAVPVPSGLALLLPVVLALVCNRSLRRR